MNQRSLFLRHLAQTSPDPMLFEVVSAKGVYLIDAEGKQYIDFISGIAVSNVGHCDEDVTAAIVAQAQKYLHTMVYGEHVQTPQVMFAKRLAELLGPMLDHVYFVNSGSEATEGALKLAKKYTGRTQILAFKDSYHGSTHGALSVLGADGPKEGYGPLLPGVEFMDFNDFAAIDRITHETACVIVEPIQGEAGVRLPQPGFLKELRHRCDLTGTLLILDEIQTGMGRTGVLFAHQQERVLPDILLLGKALGGGMPLGAFITRGEMMEKLSHDPVLGHITTFGGHPVSCAAGLAALDKIQREDLAEKARLMGEWIRERLKHPLLGEVRGRGLMLAVEFKGDFEGLLKVAKACWKSGLLIDWFLHHDHAFRIAPPLIITKEESQAALDIFLNALDEHAQWIA